MCSEHIKPSIRDKEHIDNRFYDRQRLHISFCNGQIIKANRQAKVLGRTMEGESNTETGKGQQKQLG